ncbi:SDR family NAD(P)-dependent oxidoreductase [Candidatus Dojkabacteria bacterium]|nr:SDR family NAD(P)-dependent oxidoreductase [Candidatus Dojkabacteria bacterium]
MKLKGKTILITGASSGIGKAIALKCAKDGATIVLAARRSDELAEVAENVTKLGGKPIIVVTDVTNANDLRNLFLKATENGRVLDVVVANAGIGFVRNIHELTIDEIKAIVGVNLIGSITTIKLASEIMIRQKFGHLILTSSLAGLIVLPQWSVYSATKWGITAFADTIRLELKQHNVKVTTIHPGAVHTEFFSKENANIDLKDLGLEKDAITAEEVAEATYNAIFTDKEKVIIPQLAKNYAFLSRYLPGLLKGQLEKLARKFDSKTPPEEDEPEFSYIQPVNQRE